MRNHTIYFDGVGLADTTTIAGPKEGEGPLAKYFHHILEDDLLGQKSYEKAETKIHIAAIRNMLNKSGMTAADIDCIFAGDLLDEMIVSSFALREFSIPFIGLYNACASFAEALIVGSSMISGGLMKRVICSTSSHFSTAERQYRFPLELGSQRTPLAQWTVTGAGCTMLEKFDKHKIKITCATLGKVVDYGVKDANDMGAAMLPAAMDTIKTHFRDTKRQPSYYDMIATGDLGDAGGRLLRKMIKEEGLNIDEQHQDCGGLIFNREAQDVGQGGSGTACSNIVFNSYIYQNMLDNRIKRLLLVPTGALVSKTASLQGETMPGIAHAICIERV